MAGRLQLPLINDDSGLDRVLVQLGRLRAGVKKLRNQLVIDTADIEASIVVQNTLLSEARTSTAGKVAEHDTKSRVFVAAVVRYVLANWDRLHTSATRVMRASGVTITKTDGKFSYVTDDEDTAVAELRERGLTQFIRVTYSVDRTALKGQASAATDGDGLDVIVGEGDDAQVVQIKSIRHVQAPTKYKISFPGQEDEVEFTAEELAELLGTTPSSS